MAVQFQDFSVQVKADINQKSLNALEESAIELVSETKRQTPDNRDYSRQLKASWDYSLNAATGTARIGTPLEEGYWNEYGTGEHAVDTSKSRSGWWVYIEGGSGYEGATNHYATEEEAQAMAAFIRAKYGLEAVATNGTDPNHSFENAYAAKRTWIKNHMAEAMKELK